MKKLAALALLLALCLLFTACSSKGFADAPEAAASESPAVAAAPTTENTEPESGPSDTAAETPANQDGALTAHSRLFSYYNSDGDTDSIVALMPDDYGGCYIGENGILTLCLVSPTEERIAEYKKACGTEAIEIVEADYSFAALCAAMDALNAANKAGEILNFSWHIDEMANRVKATVTEQQRDAAEALTARYPCIDFTYDRSKPTVADHSGNLEDGSLAIATEYGAYPTGTETLNYTITNKNTDYSSIYYDNSIGVEIQLDGV